MLWNKMIDSKVEVEPYDDRLGGGAVGKCDDGNVKGTKT